MIKVSNRIVMMMKLYSIYKALKRAYGYIMFIK